jgi:archaemetzincin
MAAFKAIAFEQPTKEERLKAIGPTDALPRALKRALTIEGFAPLCAPRKHDWLAVHPESGQAFEEFRREQPNRPDAQRRIIYLQLLESFSEKHSPSTEMLRQYAAAFFQMEVKILLPVNLVPGDFTSRTNRITTRRQILTRDVLRWLQRRLPEDAFCVLGITMVDLYPDPSWNFVFGEASFRERVGVYSFARYDPAFYGRAQDGDYQKLLLWRSAKVLTHETAHMFGLAHCIYFKCVMNGSNHLQESDARPLHLCSVCLRKLQWSIGFDVVKHYEQVHQFCQRAGFEDEAAWIARRLKKVREEGHK